MKYLPQLFENNKKWAENKTRHNPRYFAKLCEIQKPEYLWIGCSDSRVPANEIVGLNPGELFVHRNIANIVPENDYNSHSVIEYAIHTLGVKHIIVCGHYNCGGVKAVLDDNLEGIVGEWLDPLTKIKREKICELEKLSDVKQKWTALCEINVIEQVKRISKLPTVQKLSAKNQHVTIHGWIYDLANGLLKDLNVTMHL